MAVRVPLTPGAGLVLIALAAGCGDAGRPPEASLDPAARVFVEHGERLFADTCATCHGPGGEGLPGRGPALRGSAWVIGSPAALVRIVLDGVRSEDAERAGTYLFPMSAWRLLPDLDVAAVTTFARHAWGHGASPVPPEVVSAVRAATSGRTRAWTREELREAPEVDGHGQATR